MPASTQNSKWHEMIIHSIQEKFEKKKMCDLVIQAKNVHIPMHGIIACVASPVLEMLCERSMREMRDTNILQLSDREVDSSSLDLVVDYMYYGSLALTAENVCGLLSSANYLQMDGAVDLCVQYMCDHITVRNALNANRLGNLYDLESLRQVSITFITRNISDVIRSDEWRLATADQLACIFDKDVLAGVTEFDIFSALMKWVDTAADDDEDRINRVTDFKTLLGDERVLRVKYMSEAEIASLQTSMIQSIDFDQPFFDEMIQNRIKTSDIKRRTAMAVPADVETILTHHTKGAWCLLVHDNKLYSGSYDSTIAVSDLTTNQLETRLTYHSSWVTFLLVHDNKLYSGSTDKTIAVYDLTMNQLETTLTHHTDAVRCLVVHENKLYSGSSGKIIDYGLRTNQIERTYYHSGWIMSLLMHDNKLYSGSWDGSIAVYDLARNHLEASLAHHTASVLCLAVHDNKLYSGSDDRTIAIYDLARNQLETTLTHHTRAVYCLLVHDNKLYSGSFKTIAVYDLATEQLEATLTHHTSWVTCLLVHDNKLYSGSHDGTIAVWH